MIVRRYQFIGGSVCLALAAMATAWGGEAALLEPGKPVERSIVDESHSYEIRAAADQFVGVAIDQRGIDVVERLFTPDGRLVAEFDDECRPQASETADFVAVQGGSYRLEVRPKVKGAEGRYTIRITGVRAATEHDRLLHEARMLESQSASLHRAGEFDQALPLIQRALAITEKESGLQDGYSGRLLNSLCNLWLSNADYSAAEECGRQALMVNERAFGPEHPESLRSTRLLGEVLSVKGENAKAEPFLQRALEGMERTLGPDHPEVGRCLGVLATHHLGTEDYSRAEMEFRRAISIVKKVPDEHDSRLPLLLNNLAVLYNNRKEYDRAEPLLIEAVQIVEKAFGPDSPMLAMQLQNLALIAQEKKKDYPGALDLYSRAIRLLEQGAGPENPRVAGILNNMANIYNANGDYTRAADLLQRVYAIARKQLGPYGQLTMVSLGNLARAYTAGGNLEAAMEYQTRVDEAVERNLTLNLAIGSERQKLAYFDSLAQRTSRTISLQVGLASREPAASALAALVVLQRKGRVLDAMSAGFAALRQRLGSADQKLFDEWNAAAGQFAKLALNGPGRTRQEEYQKRLASLEEERDRVEAEMSRRSAEFRAQSQPVTLAAVQAAIPPEAALIELAAYRPFNPKAAVAEAYGEPRYIAYVLRRDGEVAWREIGAAADIDRAVEAFREALRDPHRKDVDELARDLDRKVMAPIRTAIGGARQLLISPDGELNLIPFQALVDEQGRRLVERYSISYLSSGRDLLRLQVARRFRSGPLVMADPFFGEPPVTTAIPAGGARRSVTAAKDLAEIYFAPLPGSALEARAIQSRFPEATVLSGRQATESALKRMDAPRILHIATHGFFLRSGARQAGEASENPLLRSGLALAGANLRLGGADDGIFTALEASGLNLWGTQLVTLSACDTGIGEVKTGEGVYGLRRAFFLAGAESLVMSLWPVSDYMTRQMMTAYYTGLKAGLGRGEALRQAQLAMLKRPERRHPFYWAGFIQAGEWKNLDGK